MRGLCNSIPVNDGRHQEEKEALPTVLRRKRGRPPRARMTFNPGTGVLTAARSIHVDQVPGFHGGRIQISTSEQSDASEFMFSERLSEGRFASTEERRDEAFRSSAIVPATTRSMREVKTPMWLLESAHALPREPSCKLLALEAPPDIPHLENVMLGETRTYERRRSGLSPPYQTDPFSRMQSAGSDRGSAYGHQEFYFEDDPAEPVLRYEAVSVPIRTFPSQFTSRGDHNNPRGTFIPVETIVVNSQPKVETLSELLVPVCEDLKEPSNSQRDQHRSGGKLVLRLKLPKKKTPPVDLELPQRPPISVDLPNGDSLTPASTVAQPMRTEVNRIEQFDTEQLQHLELTVGGHCTPGPSS